jgi:hypothetical protein
MKGGVGSKDNFRLANRRWRKKREKGEVITLTLVKGITEDIIHEK